MTQLRMRQFLVILAGLLMALPLLLNAEEKSDLESSVSNTVATCTARVLSQDFDREDIFAWPTRCVEVTHANCVAAILSDDYPQNDAGADALCHTFERPAWSNAGTELRQHLVDRSQNCSFPDTVKSSMIAKIGRLDAALTEFAAAQCDYDEGQWRAIEMPEIAERRLARCLVQGEAIRVNVLYQFVLKDVGCGAGPD
jgi:hypothetical protein